MKRYASVLLILTLTLFASLSQAQKKAPPARSVSGVVTDTSGNPAPGAVVQLEDMKTLQVRSFIAKDKGDYYFTGLSMDVDYKIKAQSNGHESITRTVSSFDSHPTVTINLQLK